MYDSLSLSYTYRLLFQLFDRNYLTYFSSVVVEGISPNKVDEPVPVNPGKAIIPGKRLPPRPGRLGRLLPNSSPGGVSVVVVDFKVIPAIPGDKPGNPIPPKRLPVTGEVTDGVVTVVSSEPDE